MESEHIIKTQYQRTLNAKRTIVYQRIRFIKSKCDALHCNCDCGFYDKSKDKCLFCRCRSKMSWILKVCLTRFCYEQTDFIPTQMKNNTIDIGSIGDLDDVITHISLIHNDLAQSQVNENYNRILKVTIRQLKVTWNESVGTNVRDCSKTLALLSLY